MTRTPQETYLTILGTDDIKDIRNVQVYPNPVNDILNIETVNLIEKIEILDLSGKLISTEFYHQINVAQLTSGIYFIKVVTSEGNSLQKFAKN